MTIAMPFIVGAAIGFAIGLLVGIFGAYVIFYTPGYAAQPPIPRRQKKPRANEGTIFSSRVVKGGIH